MQVLVIGAGEVGYHTALRLSQEAQNVVVVDKSPSALRKINEQMDVQTICGGGSSPRVLREAAISQADLVVAVTDSDEVNLQASRIAKLLAPASTVIARIRSGDILDFMEEVGHKTLDVDQVINPEREVARQILQFISVPAASSVTDFAGGKVKLLGLRVPATSSLASRKLMDITPGTTEPFLIAAIERAGQMLIPGGNDTLYANDLAYVVTKESAIDSIVEYFGLSNDPVRNLVVVGGSAIGRMLAQAATEKDIKTRIIDNDEERCQQLVDQVKGAIILHGDGTDLSLLEEENAGAADVFASVTNDEEQNVLVALLGRKMGAKRTISRVAHMGYVPLVSNLGLDLVVSPRFAAVNAILRYLRRGKVINVASLRDEGAEVIEVEALETSGLVGRPLQDVKMPASALVAAVIREDEVVIPSGMTIVEPGDRLVIILMRSVLAKVEKLLTVSLEFF